METNWPRLAAGHLHGREVATLIPLSRPLMAITVDSLFWPLNGTSLLTIDGGAIPSGFVDSSTGATRASIARPLSSKPSQDILHFVRSRKEMRSKRVKHK